MTTKQQTNLKFLVRLGKSFTEVLSMLQQVYKEQTLSHATVFLWHKRFIERREDVKDDPRCGRPSTSRNEADVKLVKKMVREDRWLTVRPISDELGLNQNRVYFAQWGKKGENCGKATHGCFIRIMHSHTLHYAFGNFWQIKTLQCWSNPPIHLILLHVTFFFFHKLKTPLQEHVFQARMPLKML